MSQSEMTRQSSFDAPPAGPVVAGTRVDPAHMVASEPAEVVKSSAVDESPAVQLPAVVTLQQVRLQAAQLAAHLQRQAAGVDHREAELNARLASMEKQIRSARLWLAERHTELTDREAELARREQALDKRESPPGGQRKTAGKQSRSLGAASSDEAELAEREAELDRRAAELDEMAARLADQLAAAREVEAAQRSLGDLEHFATDLQRAEQLLASEQAELERQRRVMAEEQATFGESIEAERQLRGRTSKSGRRPSTIACGWSSSGRATSWQPGRRCSSRCGPTCRARNRKCWKSAWPPKSCGRGCAARWRRPR